MSLKWFRKLDPIEIAGLGLALTAVIAIIYYYQLRSMQDSVELARKNMQIDQRAWLYPNIPNFFPLNGDTIPANIQISNIGKTLATNILGHVVGTTFSRGDTPSLDQYGIGYAHDNVYVGAVYPAEAPLNAPITIVKYGVKAGEQPTPIHPDPELVRKINNNETYIMLFGEIRYCDVFGVPHWVKFCNGSGNALSMEGIKECIYYNRADNNTDPEPVCQHPPAN